MAEAERGPAGRAPDAGLDDAARDDPRRAIQCAGCGADVSHPDAVFAMADHCEDLYLNPAGMLMRVLTVRAASGLRLVGEPILAHTWFPGYTWTIALCGACGAHVGWRYDRRTGTGGLAGFWGLLRTAVRVVDGG